jgi:hypothetical protein
MLYTDNDIASAAALLQIDSEVVTTAAATKPSMVLEGFGSICEQAWRECGQTISAAQQLYSTYMAQPGISAGHMAAINNTGVPARTQPRIKLNQIVAHEPSYANSQSAIQLWVAYSALTLLYRDASSRLDKDRYEEKMNRYRADALRHWNELRATGLPIIVLPLEAPGAKHSRAAGVWAAGNLSGGTAGSGSATPRAVQAAITWYDASKYVSQGNKGNAESGPSDVVPFTIPASRTLKVDITGLNPPAGAAEPVGTASGTVIPLCATHWNIYCGQKGSPYLYLQKEGVPVATKTWTLAADPVFGGNVLQPGQWPDSNIVFSNVVMRG